MCHWTNVKIFFLYSQYSYHNQEVSDTTILWTIFCICIAPIFVLNNECLPIVVSIIFLVICVYSKCCVPICSSHKIIFLCMLCIIGNQNNVLLTKYDYHFKIVFRWWFFLDIYFFALGCANLMQPLRQPSDWKAYLDEIVIVWG